MRLKYWGVSSFALMMAAAGASAYADDDAVADAFDDLDDSRIETLTITGDFREEDIQDVPIAITAFDEEAIELRNIASAEDLQATNPGLYYFEQDGLTNIGIRGVGGEPNTGILSDPSVALNFDGVYLARPSLGSGAFFDVQRIEVLRGPQGTLYGRNATGGSINVVNNQPQLGEFSGEADVSVGNDDFVEYRGVVNLPLGDRAALRVSAIDSKRGPVGENLFQPGDSDDVDDQDYTYARGLLLFQPTDDTSVTLNVTYGDRGGRSAPQSAIEQQRFDTITGFVLGAAEDTPTEPRQVRINEPGFSDVKSLFLSATIEHAFDFGDLTFIGARVSSDEDGIGDGDRTEIDFTTVFTEIENEQYSAEVRLASPAGSPFQWIVGASYLTEDNSLFARFENRLPGAALIPILPPSDPPITMLPEIVIQNNDIVTPGTSESYAVFGDVTVPVTDRFRITGGLRYAYDQKDITVNIISSFDLEGLGDFTNTSNTRDADYDAVVGRLIGEFDVTDTSLFYASLSRGYKAGGFSGDTEATPYDPEFVTAFELGSKNTLIDGRLLLNGTVFYYQNDDFQVLSNRRVLNQDVLFVENSDARTLGAEFQAILGVTPSITVDASLTLLDSEYVDFVTVDPSTPLQADPNDPTQPLPREQIDLDGERKTLSPPYSGVIGVQYMREFSGFGMLLARADYSFSDEVILRPFQTRTADVQEAYSTINANVTWRSPDMRYSLEFFGRNLTDEDIINSASTVGENIGVTWAAPRSYGVRAGVSF